MSSDRGNLMAKHFDDLNVAEVRKCLAALRKKWAAHSQIRPLYTSTPVLEGLSTAEFCFCFVMSHHAKRHKN